MHEVATATNWHNFYNINLQIFIFCYKIKKEITLKEKRVTYDIHFWTGIPNQKKHNRLIINIE